MASHESPKMSLLEFVVLIGALILTGLKTYGTVIKALLLRRHPGWGIPMISVAAVLRNKDLNLTFRQMRKVMAPTGEQISAYCKSHKLTHKPVPLDCGPGLPLATLHYINCDEADAGETFYYIHGGGYCFPIVGMGHMSFALNCAKAARATKLVLLEYTLAPELKYPGQLIQSIEGLRYILRTTEPSKLIIGGDSAGGNAVLGILAHIVQPFATATPLQLSSDLRGVLLISPWVKFDYRSASYAANEKVDYVSEKILAPLVAHLQPAAGTVWAESISSDEEFWRRMAVKKVLLTAGSLEVFRDDVVEIAQRLGAEKGKEDGDVTLFVADNEVHVHAILEAGIRDDWRLKLIGMAGKRGTSATAVDEWLERL